MSNIIVFDGQCILCRRWFWFLVRRDPEVQFKFCAMQTDIGQRLLQDAGLNPTDPVSFLLLEQGRPLTDSDGIIRILEQLGGGWRFFKAARVIPRPMRDFVYRLIARNRYRIYGKSDTCLMPTPALSNRFVSDVNCGFSDEEKPQGLHKKTA